MAPHRSPSLHRLPAPPRDRPCPTPDLPDAAAGDAGEDVGARALQRRLRHAYERGEPEQPRVRTYPPGSRLALLLGATGSLWWNVYAIARVAIG